MKNYTFRTAEPDKVDSVWLSDGKIALGLTIGVLAAIVGYLLMAAYQSEHLDEFKEVVSVIPIVISLIVALVSTFLAVYSIREQKQTRQAATDPVLVAHFGQREDAREMVMFCLSNVGAGPAVNVKMEVFAPEVEYSEKSLLTNIFRTYHPFTVILQNEKVQYNLALGWNVLGDEPLPVFKAKVEYENLLGGKYVGDFELDIREMQGLGSEKSPQMRVVKAVEDIATKIGK